ncbi:MAG: hypothetical protein JMDDDDMK_02163 [Acidobacteria bacterium]|nr:hypothetical protein [Acidobacteriota bacterium]
MKKRTALNSLLLLAACMFLFSACSRQSRTTGTDTSSSGAGAATSSPSVASQPETQPSPQTPASSQAAKTGWWVRINPAATTAQTITFQVGTSKLQREEWRVWNAGEPAEFDVPEKYAQAPRLYLRGNVSPIGKLATLCLMYKDRGVEHMSFNDDDSETKSQTEIDIKCR